MNSLKTERVSVNGEVRRTPSLPLVKIYTDGGCEPNPGRGGYGVVLVHPKKRAEHSGGFRRTTNNRMEIYAVIRGLEMLKRRCRVLVYSDSQYLVKAMSKGWVLRWQRRGWWRTPEERPANVDLWQRLLGLCQTHQVEFRWLRGHAGDRENERCDRLCYAALRRPNLPVDEGYEGQVES
jgi:ribonuclease HI